MIGGVWLPKSPKPYIPKCQTPRCLRPHVGSDHALVLGLLLVNWGLYWAGFYGQPPYLKRKSARRSFPSGALFSCELRGGLRTVMVHNPALLGPCLPNRLGWQHPLPLRTDALVNYHSNKGLPDYSSACLICVGVCGAFRIFDICGCPARKVKRFFAQRGFR